jgi:hypothetical protein
MTKGSSSVASSGGNIFTGYAISDTSQSTPEIKEISDVGVRVNFINNCVHELVHYGTDKLRSNKLDDWDIDLEKKKICDEWGKHIPSLVQEIREKKLNQIL